MHNFFLPESVMTQQLLNPISHSYIILNRYSRNFGTIPTDDKL